MAAGEEVGLHRHRHAHRVHITHGAHVEAEGRAVARHGDVAEPGFASASGRERDRPLGGTEQSHTCRLRLHRRLGHRAIATIHHRARLQRVAGSHEARQRRPRHYGPRDEHRRLAAPVAIGLGDRDRHETEGREIVRQLRPRLGVAHRIGDHVAEIERGGLESRAQHFSAVGTASTTGRATSLLPFGHLRRHRDEVARESHAEVTAAVDQVERIGRLISGQRQDTFVHRPEGDLGACPHAAHIAHRDLHHGGVAGAIVRLAERESHPQSFHLGRDAQLHIAHAHGRTARIVEFPRRRVASTDHDHRDERVGYEGLGDRDLDRLRARRDADAALVDHLLALHRHPRLGVGEGRRDHDRRGVTHGIAITVGEQLHLELRLVAPGHEARSGDPAAERRNRLASVGVRGTELDRVHAAAARCDRALHRFGGRDHAARPDRVGHPLGDHLGDAVAFTAHAMPLTPHDPAVDPHTGLGGAVRTHGAHGDALRLVSAPEPARTGHSARDVEARRVHDRTGHRADHLPVHVGHGAREHHARRHARTPRRHPHGDRPVAAIVERVDTTREVPGDSALARRVPGVVADHPTIEARDAQLPRPDALLARLPVHVRPGHRRAEQIARRDAETQVATGRTRGRTRGRARGQVDQELGRPVLTDAVVGARDRAPGAAPLEHDPHAMRPHGRIRRQLDDMLRGPEVRKCHRAREGVVVLAIAQHPAHRIDARRTPQRAERSRAHDRLEMHLLTWPVDPTLGEDRAGDRESVPAPGRADPEAPRVEILVVPVDRDECAIAAESHRHIAALGRLVLIGLGIGTDGRVGEVAQLRESLRVGAGGREYCAVGSMQRDFGVRPRLAVAHAGHPDRTFLRTEPRRDTQIRDLHERDGRVGESGVLLGECAAAHLHRVERRSIGACRVGDREGETGERTTIAPGRDGDPTYGTE